MKNILFPLVFGVVIGYFAATNECHAQTEVYKDSSGAIVGRSNVVNGQTVYTNDIGQIVGRSSMNGNTTVYQNSTGAIVGRSTQSAPDYGSNYYKEPVPPRGPLRPLPLPKGVYPWMLEQQ